MRTITPTALPAPQPTTHHAEKLVVPGPLFPWLGSKRAHGELLDQLIPPTRQIQRYLEPFLGSAAAFFQQCRRGFSGRAHLSDLNKRLIKCFQGIQRDPQRVINLYAQHAARNGRDYFLRTRESYNFGWDDATAAAWFLFIAKASYGGMYRENRLGVCNSPWRGLNLAPLRTDVLLADSIHLQRAEIISCDFAAVLDAAGEGDFAFFDSPYPNGFVGYTSIGFGESDHHRLRRVCVELHRRGALFLQTNADCDFIRRLYKDFHVESVIAPRRIANGRGVPTKAKELLIMNY